MTLLGTVPGNGQTSFLIRFGEHSVNEQRAEYSRQGKGRAELPNGSGINGTVPDFTQRPW